jgi:hypothetical protein
MAFMKFPSGEFMVVGPIPKDAEYKTVGDKQSSLQNSLSRHLKAQMPQGRK